MTFSARALSRRLLLTVLIAAPLAACGGTEVRVVGAGGASGSGQTNSGGSKHGGGGTEAVQGGDIGIAGAIPANGGALGFPYLCLGGFVLEELGAGGSEEPAAGAAGATQGDTGAPPTYAETPWTGMVGGAVSCIVGESYCHIESSNEPGFAPTGACIGLSGSLAACSDTPNCACLCAHGAQCHTECSCRDDIDGVATVSCFPI
jgi:hypothetical protein